MTKYPFTSKNLSEGQLRDWLTSTIYPNEYRAAGSDRTRAKRRVTSRIHYARKQGALPKSIQRKIDAASFFEWACNQKGWEALQEIRELPKNVTVSITPFPPMIAGVSTPLTVSIPESVAELQLELLDYAAINQRQTVRIGVLEKENTALKNRLKTKRQRAEEASKAGKKARGIKKK